MMNKIKTLVLLCILSVSAYSQTYLDALRYSQPQYQGTARFMSMGGAFGSLGGDYSAIGVNPAGIATYRSSEFSFTPSLIINSTDGDFNGGDITTDGKTTFAINQIGYVGTFKPMREVKKGIVSTHFAIGYNRNNNFNYKSMASAANYGNSMTDMFMINANNGNFDYRTDLANNTYLIPWVDDNSNPNGGYYTNNLYGDDTVDQTRILEKSGNSSDLNISTGVNISNVLQLGASFNFNMLSYKERSNYYEQYAQSNGEPHPDVFSQYRMYDYLDVRGNGISLKAGFILKPLPFLRIGGSFHSPTWYTINEDYGSQIDADFHSHPSESQRSDFYTDYKFTSPLKAIGSASLIISKFAILSFDYEYIDYTAAQFKSTTNDFGEIQYLDNINKVIEDTYTQSNNFRAGVEIRFNPQFSLRGGASLQASPFKDEPYDNEIKSYTGGFGYRVNNFFIDFAYVYSQYGFSQYNYNWDTEYDEGFGAPTKGNYNSTDHYAVMTMGWKF
ncbi:OmpP1/FadL family transporter [Saccharicrinis aurantiacus]|uniref:OmpP1/FadL family transporter n=1 Tax=Saccharicrinis aurantiacus TaxID=1849719 RepID=UPI00094F5998|nr:hypothetical protein [Saccharicrinis aurantiacus]